MRRLASHIILTALLTAVLSFRAGAQDSYLDRIEWLPGEMVIGVDSADGSRTAVLDMVLRWKDRPWAAPQHTVCIVPVLYGQDSTMAFSFAPIYIDGRIRSKALEREAVLDRRQVHREEGSFVVEVGRKAPLAVRYTESLPYNAAMLDGYVVLYETVHGCADCLEGTDSLRLADVLPRYVPDWAAPGFMQSPDGDNKIIAGGPMMGKALMTTGVPVCKGTNSITVLSGKEAVRDGAIGPCIRCAKCVGVCPMGLEPYILATSSAAHNWEMAEEHFITSCIECGSCQYTCPANRPMLDNIRFGKSKVMTIIRARKQKS